MSTQDTAALIESVNKMTDTVAGKIEEIDQEVQAATAAVPGMLSLTLYVNASTGDDDTGTGSSSAPFKTIKKAVDSTISVCYLTINLRGGSIDDPHLIDNTIELKSRRVEIVSSSKQIKISDNLTTLFRAEQDGVLSFLCDAHRSYVHSSGVPKLLLYARGKASLFIGGYAGLTWCTTDDCDLTLVESSYSRGSRGFCEIALSRFNVEKYDATAPAEAIVKVFRPDYAGSALYNAWQSSLGNNSADGASSVVLVGSSKLISS